MPQSSATPSARKVELLEAAYRYALTHGLAGLSLRPLAKEIGSSPRVLLYLFGSKEGLVQALLTRARADELELLADLRAEPPESSADDRLVEVAVQNGASDAHLIDYADQIDDAWLDGVSTVGVTSGASVPDV
ncbi:TetR family transcriptional regulator, partial [Klebsiella pneumoniae]|nr:TetR family transcriptional regulator [Klebsiella pneumoniae]